MVGHHTRLQENDDLPLARSSRVEKATIFNACTLIAHEIMCRGMCNAILGNDLNHLLEVNERRLTTIAIL